MYMYVLATCHSYAQVHYPSLITLYLYGLLLVWFQIVQTEPSVELTVAGLHLLDFPK